MCVFKISDVQIYFRQTPSPHRNFFPSPGYPSLIPRIGGGTNKHVYAPILPPSRLYDSTPIPSPPPPLLQESFASGGAVSPVRRVSLEAPREKGFENNLESGEKIFDVFLFKLTLGKCALDKVCFYRSQNVIFLTEKVNSVFVFT